MVGSGVPPKTQSPNAGVNAVAQPGNDRARRAAALLSQFESAVNRMDVKAMLDCLDPSVGAVANIAFSLFGSVIDSEIGVPSSVLEQFVEYLPDIMRVMIGAGFTDASMLPRITITPLEYQMQPRYVHVRVRVSSVLDGVYSEEVDWIDIDDSGGKAFISVGLPDF
jgi:hypothetical protein